MKYFELRKVRSKIAIEVTAVLCYLLPLLYMYIGAGNGLYNVRGFFCDDENLKHPYVKESPTFFVLLRLMLIFLRFIFGILGVNYIKFILDILVKRFYSASITFSNKTMWAYRKSKFLQD